MKQLKLKSTRLPVDEDVLLTFVEDPNHDCWNPFTIFCFCIDHCHPRAKKFYARVVKAGAAEEKRLEKEFGKPIWHCESGKGANWNLGPSKHRSHCMEIAKLSGVKKYEDCTGHALCALCITHCIAMGLTCANVAAKVRHASMNSSLTYAQGCNKRKANRLAAMNPDGQLAKKGKSGEQSIKKLKSEKKPAAVDLSEKHPIGITQPFKPENRSKFERLASDRPCVAAASVATAAPVAMVPASDVVHEEKENESPNSKLKRLEMENKILRLQQENARMKASLSGSPSRPTRHYRNSCPPSGHRGEENRYYHSPMEVGFQGGYNQPQRHSYPMANRQERSRSPPRCYREPSYRHGEEFDEDYGDCHRRH